MPEVLQQASSVARRSPRTMISQVFSVPNQLTMLRMLLLPFVLISMIYLRHDIALGLFLAAAVTDVIDGLVARHFNQKTALGEFLDPIADKLLLSSCFVVQSLIGVVPWWITIFVLLRDVVIISTALVVVLTTSVRDFPPSAVGKANTIVQVATILSVLIGNVWPESWPRALTTLLIWVAAATTVMSAVHYALETSRRVNTHDAGAAG